MMLKWSCVQGCFVRVREGVGTHLLLSTIDMTISPEPWTHSLSQVKQDSRSRSLIPILQSF